MHISLIAAMNEKGVIGKDNKLPWHIPEDLQYFKRMTLGKPIIMGRKTLASMNNRLLPDRTNIILSKDPGFTKEGAIVVHDVEDALKTCQGRPEVMVIGGSQIYQLFLPMATRIYMTFVHNTMEGDTFFPEVNWQAWQKVSEEDHPLYSWVVFEKK